MSNFTLSPMIPNLNLIVYELFHEHLLSDNNEPIIDIKKITKQRLQDF